MISPAETPRAAPEDETDCKPCPNLGGYDASSISAMYPSFSSTLWVRVGPIATGKNTLSAQIVTFRLMTITRSFSSVLLFRGQE